MGLVAKERRRGSNNKKRFRHLYFLTNVECPIGNYGVIMVSAEGVIMVSACFEGARIYNMVSVCFEKKNIVYQMYTTSAEFTNLCTQIGIFHSVFFSKMKSLYCLIIRV